MNRGNQGQRSGKGYHTSRPIPSHQNGGQNSNNISNMSSGGAGTKELRGRTDAGDQFKGSVPPPHRSGSDSPVTTMVKKDNSGSDGQKDSVRDTSTDSGHGATAGPDSTSSQPESLSPLTNESVAGAADDSEVKDTHHYSDLNGAPIVATAASGHQNGGNGGHYNNRNWNNANGYRSRGPNRHWGMSAGRGSGSHNGHSGRPPHMPPISSGYTGPPNRRYAPGPQATAAPFPLYAGYAPSLSQGPPLHIMSLPHGSADGASAGAAALLPTPASGLPAGYMPFPTMGCNCSNCQLYLYHVMSAAAAQSVYGLPAGGIYGPAMSAQQAAESFTAFQSGMASAVMDTGNGNNCHPVSGMSPRPKGAPPAQPTVMFMTPQSPAQQKHKPNDPKGSMNSIAMNTGLGKQQQQSGPRPQDQQIVTMGAWSHQVMAQQTQDPESQMQQAVAAAHQTASAGQQSQAMATGLPAMRFAYVSNQQLMPGLPVHDMPPGPLYHDMIGAPGPAFISGYPRY